jgi:hypothetical protein
MAKVKKSKSEKAEQSTQLPLDDMRWRPVAEIFERLFPHIGNKSLIAQDLTEALASGKIRCMRRNVQHEHTLKVDMLSTDELHAIASGRASGEIQPAGHREPVPASFWTEHCFACSSNGDIHVELRPLPNHHGPSGPSFTWIWAFYLCQPDCERVWPALAPQAVAARKAEASEPLRRKPGRRPTKNWKLEVAVEVGLHLRQGKPIPTAKALAQFCLDELDYEPDTSDVQKWLRVLLGY